jgi:hypothetical protein
MKINIPVSELCSSLPPEFAYFINECRNLKFEDKPDYSYFKKIFKERFVKEGFVFDSVFDWHLVPLKNRKVEIIPKRPIYIDFGDNFSINTHNNEDDSFKN